MMILNMIKNCMFFFFGVMSVHAAGITLEKRQILRSQYSNLEVVMTNVNGNLSYSLSRKGETIIKPSRIGMVLNNDTLGKNSYIRLVGKRDIDETYQTRGFHTLAVNRSTEYTYEVKSPGGSFLWQARLYADGFAFRYLLGNVQPVRMQEELTEFRPSASYPVWFFERTDGNWKLRSYAGVWTRTRSDSLSVISPNGPIQGTPLVYELPNQRYMAIVEAALYNYSGMRLEARQDASLHVNFTEGNNGFVLGTQAVTPWRVVLVTEDLDQLVNTDLVTSLNPAPSNELFADISWIKYGRAVWSWWSDDKRYMTIPYEKHLIDRAAELGFEYTLIDEGWEKNWSNKWMTLKDLCDYAQSRQVRVFVWKHSNQLDFPENNYKKMASFLDSVQGSGAVGIKVDFMNGESKSLIDFDVQLLRQCAQRKLLVDLHGCQKPSGEFRSYPNEVTREGVRGLELNRMNQPLPSNHNVALVFTRGILNNMDYTPIGFSNPGTTTWAHQLATGFAFTSPFLVVAEHPDTLCTNPYIAPMLPLLKAMPTVWDETKVLPGSSISSRAVLARRKGNIWYCVVLNGKTPFSLRINTNFLGKGRWKCYGIMDHPENPKRVIVERKMLEAGEDCTVFLAANGGTVMQFIQL